MNRILLAIAGFMMALALVAAAPGMAGAAMIDLQFGENGLSFTAAPQGGQNGSLAGQITVSGLTVDGNSYGGPVSGALSFSGTATNFINAAGLQMYSLSTAANGITFNATVHSNGLPYTLFFIGGLTSAGLYETNSAPAAVVVTGPFSGTLTIPSVLAALWNVGTTSRAYGGLYSYQANGVLQIGSVVTFDLEPTPIPVPSALLLFAVGLLGLIGIRKSSKG